MVLEESVIDKIIVLEKRHCMKIEPKLTFGSGNRVPTYKKGSLIACFTGR